MSDANQREEAIFEAAMALPPEQRGAYLDQACGEDVHLRRQLAALLEAHALTRGVFEQTVPLRESMVGLSSPVTERPGDRIGRYKLLQQIGEGGCGAVYMAEQLEPVKRLVALKVIKPGMDTRQVLARFDAERQALALMDHPNIAKVLDAGATETGRPFFVMELVRGVKITDYCDDPHEGLSTPKRLDLFIQVCSAIQHAHQKGIIHRDIKPSNVLVTSREDGTPMPKVIDFGIAKATAGQTLTDKTVFTAFEQFIGTPAYMSPEQAAMSAPDIDTRSDIYGLGVLLYELLTGKTPFDSKRLVEAGFDEVRRIIREEEPPRPSARLTSLAQEEQTTIARRHRSDPPRLIRLMRGELDWIVMKCLEKDRTRRYDTAMSLAGDIQRYMRNEPVVACPPSRLYRFQKLVRRHRLAFAAAAAVGLSLTVALMALGFWVADRASTAERQKRVQVKVAEDEARLRRKAETEATRARAAEAEAKMTLAASDRAQAALHLFGENKSDDALAYLARSLSVNPQDHVAATQIANWLTSHAWLLPRAWFQCSNSITTARSSPDLRYVVLVGPQNTASIWDTETGHVLRNALKHEAQIHSAEFSSDGTKIVTAADDGTARVWQTQTGDALSPPLHHSDRVNAAQFSPNGNLVVTVSRDQTAKLWDWSSGQPLIALLHNGEVRAAEFSPDGTKVLTTSDDKTARVWDVATGKSLVPPMKHASRVVSGHFSPDGTRIVTACPESTALVWNAMTGRPIAGPLPGTFGVWTALFSHDGKWIVTTSWGKTAIVWSAETGKQALPPLEHMDMVELADFDSDDKRLLTGCRDGTFRIWDAHNGQLIGEPARHGDAVIFAQFSADGQRALTAARDGTACLWDIRNGQSLTTTLKHGAGLEDVDFDPDGKGIKRMKTFLLVSQFAQFSPDARRLIVASADNTARICDAGTGELLAQTLKHDDGICSVEFSPDGKRVVTASRDRTAVIWSAETGRAVIPPLRHKGWVLSAEFSPDANRLVTASQDGSARFWDANTGQQTAEPMKHMAGVRSAQFSRDGRSIVTASWDGTARVWDGKDGKPKTGPLNHGSWVWSARFSPDGSRVVTASEDFTTRVWDAQTGDAVTPPLKHDSAVYYAEFSPDGKTIVTSSGGVGGARIWDASTGHLLTQPLKHNDIIRSAVFSPDGKRIVTASADHTARVWDASTGDPLTEVFKHNGTVCLASFSPDSERVVTASTDGLARIWDIAPASAKYPDWLRRLAEAISGRALNKRGVLEPCDANRAETIREIRDELAHAQSQDDWTIWGRWLLADRSTRTMGPFSTITISDYIDRRIKQNTDESLDEAGGLALQATSGPELLQRIALARDALHPLAARARKAELLESNGVAQARAGHWKEAVAEFSRLIELDPGNPTNYHSMAALLVQSGDTEAYRRHCNEMLAHFGNTTDPVTAERMAKDCLIVPSCADIAATTRLAKTAIRSETNHPFIVYFQFAKGLSEYRQEHLTEAAEWMEKVVSARGNPARLTEALAVLAMAEARLNDAEQARAALSQADTIVRDELPKLESGDIGAGWIDWIIAHALLREASNTIAGPPKNHPSGL